MNDRLRPGTKATIRYRDADGNASDRLILVKSVSMHHGHEYVTAWCFQRNAERTFRADRIMGAAIENREVETKSESDSQPAQPAVVPSPAPAVEPGRSAAPASGGGMVVLLIAGAIVSIVIKGPELFKASAYHPPAGYTATLVALQKKSAPVRSQDGPWRRDTAPDDRVISRKSETYRGYRIVMEKAQSGVSYKVDAMGGRYATRRQAVARVNGALFTKRTGIASPKLLALYAAADRNGDGRLSWEEAVLFQKKLYADYAYLSNDTALRPDEFLAAGGGDCDDWALVSCGLFRYWGIEAYVGILTTESGNGAHAVCLAFQTDAPSWGISYRIEAGRYRGGASLEAGYCIPVDYRVAGGLSSAVGSDWKLTSILVPEEMYGKRY